MRPGQVTPPRKGCDAEQGAKPAARPPFPFLVSFPPVLLGAAGFCACDRLIAPVQSKNQTVETTSYRLHDILICNLYFRYFWVCIGLYRLSKKFSKKLGNTRDALGVRPCIAYLQVALGALLLLY